MIQNMSRKFVQTKLSFSQSQPKLSPRKRLYPFKKSRSDNSARLKMNYAQAARSSGSGRGTQSSGSGKGLPGSPPNHRKSRGEGLRPHYGRSNSYGSQRHAASWSPYLEDDKDKGGRSDVAGTSSSSNKAASSGDNNYEGTPLQQLRKAPACLNSPLPFLRPSSPTHTVLFRVPPQGWQDERMIPYPNICRDEEWDFDHVHMPYSKHNVISSASGAAVSRWEQIEAVLGSEIPGIFELEEAILSYNQHYASRWTFDTLKELFVQDAKKKDDFFTYTLPFIQKLALMLPSLVTQSLPILKQGHSMKLTLSQQQAACLLANAFFCTFPKRNARVRSGVLPDINFSNMYKTSSDLSRKLEKLKCVINYFERIRKKMPTGVLTYSRHVLPEKDVPDWSKCGVKLTDLHVSSEGNIEDDGEGMLQADFANKYVGGGVLGHGLVQEEIRFVICPEMILARLFTQVLQDNEVLLLTGCERFNNYTGYSNTFKFTGDHFDTTPRDSWGRRYTEVVAMDALSFRATEAQFEESKILRELKKAYCAFQGRDLSSNLPAVCTGNWGCGAFKGDKHLKALIQLMAASVAGRQMCYFTFGDEELCSQLKKVHGMLQKMNVTVKEVYNLTKEYSQRVVKKRHQFWNSESKSLFEYIAEACGESLKSSGESSTEPDYSEADFSSMDWPDSDNDDDNEDKLMKPNTP